VIAEPGRFLVAPAATAIASVVGKAWRGSGEHRRLWYYLDDGVYGSFSGQVFDHTRYPVTVPRTDGPVHRSVLAGPTCDSFDVIAEDLDLPEQDAGDLVVTPMMGAYTAASATDFNGMPRARVIVVDRNAVTELARSA
jgi:ornithine decarboxylase